MSSIKGDELREFSSDRLSRLSQVEGWHFWFAGRRALVDHLLDRHIPVDARVLDLGCGTGGMVLSLARRGNRAVGMDFRPEGLAAVRLSDDRARLVRADAAAVPFAPGGFDAVMLLDVLEHVDDRALLVQLHEIVRPGGKIVLTVPAMPSLWSYRDEDAGHRRRYTKRSIEQSVRAAGFDILELRYYQFVLLPFVIASRLAGRIRRAGRATRDLEERRIPVLNEILSFVNRSEVRLSRYVPLPAGSTLAAVCIRR